MLCPVWDSAVHGQHYRLWEVWQRQPGQPWGWSVGTGRGWESWVHSALRRDGSSWIFLLASAALGEGIGKKEWGFLEVIISCSRGNREKSQLRKFWLAIQKTFFTMRVVKQWDQNRGVAQRGSISGDIQHLMWQVPETCWCCLNGRLNYMTSKLHL